MDYTNYPERIKTAGEWLQAYKEYVTKLENNKLLSEEKIAEYKANFFALEVLSSKYDEQKKLYPEHYLGNRVDDVAWLLPIVEEIMDIFESEGDRYIFLDKINMMALETLITLCNRKIGAFRSEVLVPSVVASLDNAFEVAVNEKTDKFYNEDGTIDVDRIICEYPKEIIVIRELVTQKIFKGAMKDGSLNETYKGTKKKISATLLNMAPDELETERELSYYDWAVMEAINALYLAGNEVVDLDSIEAVLKHSSQKGTSDSKKAKREQTLLFDSVVRLTKNYISISDDKYGFEESGYLIDGEVVVKEGKCYLKINSECILARYACLKRHVNTYPLDELKLNLSYSDNTIAIYRYMIQCVTEIYGTPKIYDKVNGQKRLNPKNVDYEYISCKKAYVPILGKDSKNTSKQETLRKRMNAILEEMKRLKFIDETSEYVKEKGNQHFTISRSNESINQS